LRLNLHGTILEGKSIGLEKEIELKGELMIQKPRQKLESEAESNSHIQFDSNETKLVPGPPSKVGLRVTPKPKKNPEGVPSGHHSL
jgi:hypothetical protein